MRNCKLIILSVFTLISIGVFSQEMVRIPVPVRPADQTDVLGLRCDPIPTVRVGFIGLGMRGKGAVNRFMAIEGVEIKALCDLEQYNLDEIQEAIAKQSRPEADEYTGQDGSRRLCERQDIDLIYIYVLIG